MCSAAAGGIYYRVSDSRWGNPPHAARCTARRNGQTERMSQKRYRYISECYLRQPADETGAAAYRRGAT